MNQYEIVAPTEATDDIMPLFRITSDGISPQPLREQSIDQGGSTPSTPPPVPEKGADLLSQPHIHGLIETDSTIVAYAEAVLSKSSTAPPPTAAENVVYHEVQSFQNPQVYRNTRPSALLTPTPFNPRQNHNVCVCMWGFCLVFHSRVNTTQ